ncbi:BEM46-like protein, putative [Hepatocystis sp. ex Piliocolobus tephrosceles]|nr:BEM46-like protein, putative [Hepatocystis sp. ex Piliocolobus tephrosceles]
MSMSIIRNSIVFLAVGVILFVMTINTYIYFYQDKLIFKKQKINPSYQTHLKLNYNIVSIDTSDGLKHTCWFIKRDKDKGDNTRKPVLLYFSGNGGYLESSADIFEEILKYLDVYIFSCSNRGCGAHYNEAPSEVMAYSDGQIYLDYLRNKFYDNIIIFGNSMGCATALEIAVNNQQVKGVIIQNPFTSVKSISKIREPILSFFIINYNYLLNTSMNNEEKVKKLDLPILINISEKDDIVPPEHGEKLFKLCPSQEKFIAKYPEGTHEFITFNVQEQYYNTMSSFIDKCLA